MNTGICTELQMRILENLINASLTPKSVALRANIIRLLAFGISPTEISTSLNITYPPIYKWKDRWLALKPMLDKLEKEKSQHELKTVITKSLKDAYRSGAPTKFAEDQVMKILSLACKSPESEGLPITHWSATTLAEHAKVLGIVTSISPRQISNFLKSRGVKTS